MCSPRILDSPKDSYNFAGAASPKSSLKESGNFTMDADSASPGTGSPVRRARARALHAAVISLELKGEDRCLVRMDVSLDSWEALGVLRSTLFFFLDRESFFLFTDIGDKSKGKPRPRPSKKTRTLSCPPFFSLSSLSLPLRRLTLSSAPPSPSRIHETTTKNE